MQVLWDIHPNIREDTYAEVKDKVVVREMDRIIVKGRNKPVTTYELISLSGKQSDYMKELLPGFQEALELYRSREWKKAKALFSSLEKHEKMVPGRSTNPRSVYSERCRNYEKSLLLKIGMVLQDSQVSRSQKKNEPFLDWIFVHFIKLVPAVSLIYHIHIP